MSESQSRTPLSALLSGLQADDGHYAAEITPDWMQGRAIYGGLSAALCLDATLKSHAGLPPLRSAQLAFIGPAGSAVEIVPTLIRQGKSTAFITADLLSEGKLAVRGNFCFGKARDSRFSRTELPTPAVSGPDECPSFFKPELSPSFAQHFDGRFAEGSLPMSGARAPDFTVWLRHRDKAIEPAIVGLAALADALPPASMCLFNQPRPISTMTWMFDVLAGEPETEDGWWLCRSTAETARDGYSSQAMSIWNRRGEPMVIGRQNVAIFA